jgi:hypothetical protein
MTWGIFLVSEEALEGTILGKDIKKLLTACSLCQLYFACDSTSWGQLQGVGRSLQRLR